MKYLLILPILLIFSCQLSPKEKAEKNIKKKMAKVEGYVPLKFGEPDSFYLTKNETVKMKEVKERMKDYTEYRRDHGGKSIFMDSLYNEIAKSIDEELIFFDTTEIPEKFFGYQVFHEFLYGNDKVADTFFILDQDYNVVLKDTLVYR